MPQLVVVRAEILNEVTRTSADRDTTMPRVTFVGDDRCRFNPQTVHRVGDGLELFADRLLKCITGDVAISRRTAERMAGVGDMERGRTREGDDDNESRPRDRSPSSRCNNSTSCLYMSRSSSTFFM
jgi:hypothetical protein